jgi:hypothetical protein
MPNAQPKRCSCVNVHRTLMREYHDREWGCRRTTIARISRFLILEAAGGTQLVARAQQAQGLPSRVQRLQSREARAVLGDDSQKRK